MKNLFLISFFIFGNFALSFGAEYHFQEGFATSSPTGWIRQCSSTSTLNHTGLPFSSAYAAKFDLAGSGRYEKNLISPQVKGAGELSFYVSKNANATYMKLYVGMITGNDTTILNSFDAFNFPNKSSSNPFTQISIPINNESDNLKIIFYATVSTDPNFENLGWFVVDDIELSKFTTDSNPTEVVERINTDFNDGTWGEIVSTAYPAGTYPSYSVNGFNFTKAFLMSGSVTCTTGEKHTNRILVGKASEIGAIEFPTLKTVGEIEIHAATGTEEMSFRIEEWTNNKWESIGTFTTRKSPDSIYNVPFMRNSETKLRIANNTSSGLYIYKISTHTFQEADELTLRSSSPTENEVVFYNLKKSATLTFNKNVEIGIGDILLNGQPIPLADCTIEGNTVTIPIVLEGTPSVNKSYTLTVSEGSFIEIGNSANLSKSITVNFQTLKTVAYPSNYSAELDVVYKNVNSTNCRMDIYYPENPEKPVPVIINMHGGGWNHGFKEEQGGFNTFFAAGYAVANVEYRMTGEATAPAAIEDVRGAMIYLLNRADELNIDRNKIVFQGGSAGGHLALTAGYLQNNRMYDNDSETYDDEIKVMAVIDKYGPADLQNFKYYTSLVRWLGDFSENESFVNSISPISLVNSDTPPTYIIHGDADPTVPYSQSVTLHSALEEAGIKNMFTTVPGGLHGGFPTEYNTRMNNEIIQFLNEVIQKMETNVNTLSDDKLIFSYFDGRIGVNVENIKNISIYNISGKLIQSTTNSYFNKPEKGFYIVKVANYNNEISNKIIIR